MTPGVLPTFQPGRWSMELCESCEIVFVLESSGPDDVKAMEILREALERHVQQNHTPAFPSDWKAKSQSR